MRCLQSHFSLMLDILLLLLLLLFCYYHINQQPIILSSYKIYRYSQAHFENFIIVFFLLRSAHTTMHEIFLYIFPYRRTLKATTHTTVVCLNSPNGCAIKTQINQFVCIRRTEFWFSFLCNFNFYFASRFWFSFFDVFAHCSLHTHSLTHAHCFQFTLDKTNERTHGRLHFRYTLCE